jgi:16S rRNA (uracil1498-N3)-methyltransferase
LSRVPISRIYQAVPLHSSVTLELDTNAAHHLARVLRAAVGDSLTLFNGKGGEYAARITAIDKKKVMVEIGQQHPRDVESPLDLCLAQGISRGEKMDYTIQKAVELGVKKIIPLLTERCNVKLDIERREKRFNHWQAIVISACEQSGRTRLPQLLAPIPLHDWLASKPQGQGFVLAPTGSGKLNQFNLEAHSSVSLLIGPEGGLSEPEIRYAQAQGFAALSLGPRILRTETAAVAALTALQCYFGDMGA